MKRGTFFLIGFMGSGKSTVAKILSKEHGLKSADLDDIIMNNSGRKIEDIFSESGESAFRRMESEALGSSIEKDYQVVACGGGVVLSPENRDILMKENTIYLKAELADIKERIAASNNARPLADPKRGKDFLDELYKAREQLYLEVAKHVVVTSGKSPDEVADEIADIINRR